jgi:DNA/RNA endonuclease YhcR with UshA esterase domain
MLKSMPDCRQSLGITSVDVLRLRWLVLIFVAVAWTNLAVVVPALSAEEPITPIAGINPSLVDHAITVQAVVSAIQEPAGGGAPYVVSLTQGRATIPLVYWPDMQPQLAAKMKIGNLIRAKVTVKLYRNHLELQISGPDAIDLVNTTSTPPPASTNVSTEAATPPPPAAVSTPPPTAMQTVIGKIKDDWVGRVVVISGTISGIDTGDKSRRLSIQDATGEIQVVLSESQLASLHVDQLVPGRVLTITGPVKLLEGKRTITPETPGAVRVVL